MLSLNKCNEILNNGSTPAKYTGKEVEEIRDMLYFFSELLIELTKENHGN
jgi:hypothetical protein